MSLNSLFGAGVIDTLGWTLVHSVWQIAVIAAALLLVLRASSRRSAGARYVIAVGGLALSVLVPIITFVQISKHTNETSASMRVDQKRIQDDHIPAKAASESAPANEQLRAGGESADGQNNIFFVTAIVEVVERILPVSFPIAVSIWLTGIALFTFRLSGGLWKLHSYRRNGTAPADDEWQTRLSNLCKGLKVGRVVELVRSEMLATPIAVGFVRPMIIVPASIFLQMSPQQLETILAHELIHIRRYDCLVNAFQTLAEILLFYHPAVWWMSAEIRREREFSADAAV